MELVLDGHALTLEQVEAVSRGGGMVRVRVGEAAMHAVRRSRELVVRKVASGEVVYGVTTGFGRLAEVAISPGDQVALQRNLLRSHAAGTGTLLPPEAVRVMLVLRANALARGHSGIRTEVLERLVEFLNRDLLPAIPEAGSVGASGDLAPLAHMALPLMGEGAFLRLPDAEGGGATAVDAGPFLEKEGLDPLVLEAKEGLALINGTQATTGLGILAFMRARRALESLEVAGAMTLEALRGTPEAFRAEVHAARPHPGQVESARRLRDLLQGSEIRESHRHGDLRVQDAYSLRCMPQVHGAGRSVLGYVEEVLAREANAATDNPLIFPDAELVVSAGNFHAQVVSQALDFLCIAMTDLASVSERRLERLLNPDLSGLPAFLTPHPGLCSGYMILQVTVVDLLAEMRVLAHPASVDSVSTSASQEDHVSMGMAAARKALRSVDLFERVVAAELLAAAQGIDFRRPLRTSAPLERIHARIRDRVARLEEDRPPAPDLEAVRMLVTNGLTTGL
ncbi:MAG: histidine ammonia-lyase [Gemmatimonadales bacterium]|nr:MAG: histidine ammonia-lyase [Gemmatimonadales bacterium]